MINEIRRILSPKDRSQPIRPEGLYLTLFHTEIPEENVLRDEQAWNKAEQIVNAGIDYFNSLLILRQHNEWNNALFTPYGDIYTDLKNLIAQKLPENSPYKVMEVLNPANTDEINRPRIILINQRRGKFKEMDEAEIIYEDIRAKDVITILLSVLNQPVSYQIHEAELVILKDFGRKRNGSHKYYSWAKARLERDFEANEPILHDWHLGDLFKNANIQSIRDIPINPFNRH